MNTPSALAEMFNLRGGGRYPLSPARPEGESIPNEELATPGVREYLAYYLVECFREDHLDRRDLTRFLCLLNEIDEQILRTLYEYWRY